MSHDRCASLAPGVLFRFVCMFNPSSQVECLPGCIPSSSSWWLVRLFQTHYVIRRLSHERCALYIIHGLLCLPTPLAWLPVFDIGLFRLSLSPTISGGPEGSGMGRVLRGGRQRDANATARALPVDKHPLRPERGLRCADLGRGHREFRSVCLVVITANAFDHQ